MKKRRKANNEPQPRPVGGVEYLSPETVAAINTIAAVRVSFDAGDGDDVALFDRETGDRLGRRAGRRRVAEFEAAIDQVDRFVRGRPPVIRSKSKRKTKRAKP